MRWGLLGVRLSIAGAYLIITAIIVMSLLPLASGKLVVSVPDEGIGEPIMDGNRVIMTVPVDITNGGYFDIQGLTVRFRIVDGATVITDQSSTPVNIVAGQKGRVNLSIVVDLDDLEDEDLRGLVFNAATLDLEVGVEARYSLGLVKASISTEQEMEWKPLISNAAIDVNNLRWESNGTNVDVFVPYHFEASDLVHGKTVGIQARISNSTAVLGTVSESLTVGRSNDGVLRFVISQEAFLWLQAHPESLVLGADLSMMGATMHIDRVIPVGGSP